MKRLLAHLGHILAALTWTALAVDLVYYWISDTYVSKAIYIATDRGSILQLFAALWISLVFLLIYLEEE